MSAAEEWLRRNRDAKRDPIVEFSETGGRTFSSALPASDWTVFPVKAGTEGSISRLTLDGFSVAVVAKRTSPGFWRKRLGNPFKRGKA